MIAIRPAKEKEIIWALEHSPVRHVPGSGHTLSFLLKASTACWVGQIDGDVACAFGVVQPSILSDSAYLWLLHTDLVEQHKFMFIHYSQIVLKIILDHWPRVVGHADVRNDKAIRWLRWLGATFIAHEGEQLTFEIRKQGKWPS